ncbi:hypothetical protein [Namhaeicola litoreus]|uniref:Tetratricopeptide repeat protein n=1 Tax=Namhaeicola litoreus TaxID=1052145 RepID=A0ABW3Y4S5_9FLAO
MAINLIDLTVFLDNPHLIDKEATKDLEEITHEFPYFQAARAIHLHGLHKQNSYKYNLALKQTAAHTTDRQILFDLITSDKFQVDQVYPGSKVIKTLANSEDDSPKIPSILGEEEDRQNTENELMVGRPIHFKSDDQLSFYEWMQLSNLKPIEREDKTMKDSSNLKSASKNENFALIEKFISKNPKIGQIEELESPIIHDTSTVENEQLMTETLAHVYLEQKKYKKAITAFQILSLKYPEKSSFFAHQIDKIKDLQSYN